MRNMKINGFFLFLLIVTAEVVCFRCGFAEDVPPGMVRINGRLAAEDAGLNDWKGSLENVEQSAAVFLEINRKLMEERERLVVSIQVAQDKIKEGQKTCQSRSAELRERKASRRLPAIDPFVAKTYQVKTSVADKKKELLVLKDRLKGMDRKTDLLRLRLSELELEKKAIALEKTFQSDEPSKKLRSEIDSLKERLAGIASQEKAFRNRVSRSEKLDKTAFFKKKALVTRQSGLKAVVETDEGVVFEENGLVDKQKLVSLEKENAYIDQENKNLRENIAVLEYKIHSLQSYRDRKID